MKTTLIKADLLVVLKKIKLLEEVFTITSTPVMRFLIHENNTLRCFGNFISLN